MSLEDAARYFVPVHTFLLCFLPIPLRFQHSWFLLLLPVLLHLICVLLKIFLSSFFAKKSGKNVSLDKWKKNIWYILAGEPSTARHRSFPGSGWFRVLSGIAASPAFLLYRKRRLFITFSLNKWEIQRWRSYRE
jgi:hypothetical protein